MGDDSRGFYARVPDLVDVEIGGLEVSTPKPPQCCSFRDWSGPWWRWIKIGALCVLLLAAAAVLVVYGAPFIIRKVLLPFLDWITATLSRPILALLLFGSIAIFPSLIFPSAPSMWLAGVKFGYGYGFLLIMGGISIGMSLPFFIGSLCRSRIHRWLEKNPDKAAIIRLAGEGDWFHQFKAVALIRISPFPYILFNYAAVATNVEYGPYICGSLAGTVHETFLTIYSGRLVWSLADATNKGGGMSRQQLFYDAVGVFATVSATAIITLYAKRALRNLQDDGDKINTRHI